MDQPASELLQHLPALQRVLPTLVSFAKASPEYPLGMGSRYLDLVVVQAINDVLGNIAIEPRLKGYWIAGYWPSFKTDPPDKRAQLELEFGQRTVCHVGAHVISSDGVEVWEEFKARMFAAAVALCDMRGMKVGSSQFVLVDLQVGAFSLSSSGTEAAALHLKWLLGQYWAHEEANTLSSLFFDQPCACSDPRRL